MNKHEPIIQGLSIAWDGHEVGLSLSPNGLKILHDFFRKFDCEASSLICASQGGAGTINNIVLAKREGRLMVSVDGATIGLAGSPGAFSLLADNMETLLSMWNEGGNQHFHFDPSSDTLLLDPDSEAIILSRQ